MDEKKTPDKESDEKEEEEKKKKKNNNDSDMKKKKDESNDPNQQPSSSKKDNAVAEKVESSSVSTLSEDDEATVEMIRKYMAEKLGFTEGEDRVLKVLDEVNLNGVIKYMQSEKCKNIIVMAGAGISTSAGIPDFRSPRSGLYNNLSKYNLPYPQAIFEIDFFKDNPKPFYELAKELFPGSYKPTLTHYFVRFLHEKGLLLRHYTQNVDGLEKLAGIPAEKIVEAHGTFYTSHCLDCEREYSVDFIKEKIFADEIPHCTECEGLVKPDIVFFGENLPVRFFTLVKQDFPEADLLIIMGSSLAVQPFASLIDRVTPSCPRLLLNKELTGQRDTLMSLLGLGGGLDLDSERNYRDVAVLGTCDELVTRLLDLLGWTEEFDRMMESLT